MQKPALLKMQTCLVSLSLSSLPEWMGRKKTTTRGLPLNWSSQKVFQVQELRRFENNFRGAQLGSRSRERQSSLSAYSIAKMAGCENWVLREETQGTGKLQLAPKNLEGELDIPLAKSLRRFAASAWGVAQSQGSAFSS